jgi:hypothetical protein
MTIQHSRSVIGKIVAARTSKLPHVKIRNFTALSNDSARIFAEVTGEQRDNEQAISEAVSNLLDNRLHSVSNSFCVLAENNISSYVTGVVTANREVVAVANELEGYRCLSNNMYIDTEDRLWTLKANDSGKLMIRTDSLEDMEAMEQLMASISSAKPIGIISPFADKDLTQEQSYLEMLSSVQGGDFVDFVDPISGTSKFGVVVASVIDEETEEETAIVVLASDADQAVTINKQAVIDLHDQIDQAKIQTDTAYDSVSADVNLESLVEYYRSMFRRNAEYFAEFEARLRSHFS